LAGGRGTRIGLVVAAVLALNACGGGEQTPVAAGDPGRGEALFAANCAACHGPEAIGTMSGPPLVHPYYEPGHHADESFQLAVAQGAPQHHWIFGPMPAIPGLDRQDVTDIVAYVRQLQREAGIAP
jgi:mono/diheme cytochrome c family protein